jgi:hypothetical protein
VIGLESVADAALLKLFTAIANVELIQALGTWDSQ